MSFDPSRRHGDVDAGIVAALERLSQALRVSLRERAEQSGLSPIQARFLIFLLHRDVSLRRVGRLADEFDLTPATVSDAIGSLESKGLIERQRWPEDRRVITLHLTPAGEKTAAELSTWADVVTEHVGAAPDEEKETSMRFLMRLIASLQKDGVITVARMCVSCRFFREHAHPGSRSPHHCALLDVPLGDPDLRMDCPEHETARN